MKILVTGADGFVGKNLIAALQQRNDVEILAYDIATEASLLHTYCQEAEFVFHLAGVNRPQNTEEFMEGNFGFASTLLDLLKTYQNTCPVLLSSSVQAELDNPYGKSKKVGEDLFFAYAAESVAAVFVYRLPNVFGKWCRPNYNSAVATFCYNIAHDLPIKINDPGVMMTLAYIDDVVDEFIRALDGTPNQEASGFCRVPITHTVPLGEIAHLLHTFKASRDARSIPNMADDFTKKLYAAYLSYLPTDAFAYPLQMHADDRGSFTEFIRTEDRGQVSVNISKPEITKGNHWHHTKNEKFLVVSGSGVIRFRSVFSDEVIEYFVTGDQLQAVDIPPGYTHNIENLGDSDMVTVMWVNEVFDPAKPDTYFLEV